MRGEMGTMIEWVAAKEETGFGLRISNLKSQI
jgi:hypothetical protein